MANKFFEVRTQVHLHKVEKVHYWCYWIRDGDISFQNKDFFIQQTMYLNT